MTAEELLAGLRRWEGCERHMYLDDRGFVTCGIGHLVRDHNAALGLPWVNEIDGELAAPSEIRTSFDVVKSATPGMDADWYAKLTRIRLGADDVTAIALSRLSNEFLPGLRRLWHGFDDFPAPARVALVDMAWNLGVAGLGKFTRLRDACERGHWQVAAMECRRVTSREERNRWTVEQFISAEASEAPTPGPVT